MKSTYLCDFQSLRSSSLTVTEYMEYIEYIDNIEIFSLMCERIYPTRTMRKSVIVLYRWEDTAVLEFGRYENSRKSESMLGLLGYYEAILNRKGLMSRIGEIRSLKLGLTLDLLKMVNIAEDLKANLISSLVSAWVMNGDDGPSEEGGEDISAMLSSISAVRKSAQMVLHKCNSTDPVQLDVAVMFALPLMSRDLKNDAVPEIRKLLNEAMESFANSKQRESTLCA